MDVLSLASHICYKLGGEHDYDSGDDGGDDDGDGGGDDDDDDGGDSEDGDVDVLSLVSSHICFNLVGENDYETNHNQCLILKCRFEIHQLQEWERSNRDVGHT